MILARLKDCTENQNEIIIQSGSTLIKPKELIQSNLAPEVLLSAIATLFLFCFSSSHVIAQAYAIDYSGSINFQFDDPEYLYLDDDELTSALPIGFTFQFFGNSYTDFYISSNGFITFDSLAGHGCCFAEAIPDTSNPNNYIAAVYEDLNTFEWGEYSYETIGSPPNRILVVGFSANTACDWLDAQIHLYEGSNIIEIHTDYYSSCTEATQGIENSDGMEGYYDPARNYNYFELFSDYIAFYPLLDDDAGILDNITNYCEGVQDIKTVVRNYGSNTINTLDVNWSWNGVTQTPIALSTPLAPGDNIVVTLGQQTLTFGDQDTLIAWTSLPNGNPDANPGNDSETSHIKPGMEGTFTIGGVSPDFTTINDAVAALKDNGVCDSVFMNIRPGTYIEQVEIPFISGSFGDNYVIFQSETEDSSDVIIQYTSTDYDTNYVVRFYNAYNTIFRNLTIEALGSSYGHAVEFRLNANNNSLENCEIIGKQVTNSFEEFATIYSEGVFHETTIKNCLVRYGSYGYLHEQGAIIFLDDPIDNARKLDPSEPPGMAERGGGANPGNDATDLVIHNTVIEDFHWKGIDASYIDRVTITDNFISSSDANAEGIVVYENFDTFNISFNEILLQNGDKGIFVSYSNQDNNAYSSISNNMVAIQGSLSGAQGIYLSGLTNTGVYFNSVNMSNNNANSTAFEINNPINISVKNNNFANTGGGFAYISGFAPPMASDYNNIFTTGNLLAEHGNTTLPDLLAWLEQTQLDSNSFSVQPFFTSPTDLHTVQSALNKTAESIPGIVFDFDGEMRDAMYPDIGADEFIALQNDIAVIDFISPMDTCLTDQNVTVAVKNYGSNQVSGYQVEWEVNGVSQTPVIVSNTLDTIGGTGSDTAHIVLGNLSFPEDSLIMLKAWTALPNGMADALQANDTSSIDFRVPLMGSYTIGSMGADFPSLAAAAGVLENFGVCGPVSLLFQDGTYNEQASFKDIQGVSVTNTITISSESADSSAVTIEFNSDISENYFIELDGTKFVTISHLTFKALSNFDGRILVFEEGSKNIEVAYCAFTGSPFDQIGAEIILAPSVSIEDIYIHNCSFHLGSGGISLSGFGTDSLQRVRSIVIENNSFLDQLTEGMNFSRCGDLQVNHNVIEKHASNNNYSGLRISNADKSVLIYSNKVDISTTGRGFNMNQINWDDRGTNALIYNNFVRVSESGLDGFLLYNSFNVNIYFNNINNISTSSNAAAFRINGGDTVDIQNNIFVANAGPAFYFFGNDVVSSDYNNLYSVTGPVGYYNGNQTQLTDWQNATGWDANSLSQDPLYTSPGDLHIFNAEMNAAANPIAGITTDIDGETRNPTDPDIGADEIGTAPDDAGTLAVLPETPFLFGNQDVKAVVRNFGVNEINTLDVHWEIEGVSQTTYQFTGVLGSLEEDTLTLGSFNFGLNTPYDVRIWTSLPNGMPDSQNGNDTLSVVELYAGVSGTLTIGGSAPALDSITHAFNAMLTGGVLDSVRFQLRDGTYKETIQLSDNPVFSCGNNITFEAESENAENVIWSNEGLNGAPLTLAGADGLRFRNITFEASFSSSHAHAVVVQESSHCHLFDSCRFLGIDGNFTSSNQAVVYSSGWLDTANHFINNYFQHGSYGLYWQGVGSNEDNTIVEGNSFNNQYYVGSYLGFQNATVVNNNNYLNTEPIHNNYIGIYLYQCDNATHAMNNQVLVEKGTGLYFNGCIGTSSEQGLVANNYFELGTTTSSNGITLTASPYHRVYYNTVRITGSNTSSYAAWYNSTQNLDIRNNIFYNEAGGPVYNYINSTALGVSDYNDLHTNGGLFVNTNGTDYFNLGEWQGAGFDANSLSEDPGFENLGTPHVTSALVNGAATPLAEVTLDFEGDPRDSVAPDIGADEFSPFSDDVGLLAVSYPSQPFPPGENTIFIKFINNGVDTLTAMQVDMEVDSMLQPTYYWTGLLPSAGIYDSLDIGSFDFDPYVPHSIKVWVSQPNGMMDGLSSNDTLEVSGLYPGLLGTYTIGGLEPDFDSISQAVDSLVLGGAAGPVTFNIRPGTYLETINITEFPGAGCDNLVTFQAENGDSSSVIISNLGIDDNTVTLDGADGIVFRNLTLVTVNPAFRRVVEYFNGAHCNQFLNNALIGYEDNSTSTNYAVVWSNTSHDTSNVFANNLIRFGSYGFYLRGESGSSSNLAIENNIIESYRYRGIYVLREDAVQISKNTFIASDNTSNRGIEIHECDGAIGIFGNRIEIYFGQYGIIMGNCNGMEANRGTIANNFISTGGNGVAYGLYMNNSDYQNIYFNNINTYSTTTSSTNNSSFYITNSNFITLHNNNGYNQGQGYAIRTTGNNSFVSDYNNYFSSGADMGNWNGVLQTDLSSWQSASGGDTNSVSSIPQYMSNTDLHVSNAILNSAGIALSISMDFDDELRSDPPDIGADEFVPAANDDAGVAELNGPLVPFASGIQPVEITLKNYGGNTLTSANVHWIINGVEQPVYNWTGSMASGGCDTIVIGNYNFAEYTPHNFIVWSEMPNGVADSTNVNDTLYVNDLYPALQGTYTIGGVLPDFNLFSQLEDALNTGGILGDVFFDIRDGMYSSQLEIGDYPGLNPGYTVTFRSESGDSTGVTIVRNFSTSSNNNFTVRLNNTGHLSFEHLTLESTLGRVVDIGAGSTDIEISHCRIRGVEFPSNSNNYHLIYSNTTSEDSLRFINNRFEFGSYGLYLNGSSGDLEEGLSVTGNTFLNCYYRPLYIRYQTGITLDDNSITLDTEAGNACMYLLYCYNTQSVSRNQIFSTSGTKYGIITYNVKGTSGQPAEFTNNYILMSGGTVAVYGIYQEYGDYNKYYHNTVRIENPNAGSTAFYDKYSYYNIDIQNTILANIGGGKAIHNSWTPGIHTNTMDFCNLYTSGPVLAHWANSDYSNLASLQAATNINLNSNEAEPLFSDNGYRVYQAALEDSGTPLAGVIEDIEGEGRSATMPDMGCDEFSLLPNDIGSKLLVSPVTYCGLSNTEAVTIRIQNFGSTSQTGFDVAYSLDGSSWHVENVGALVVQPGGNLDYTFSPTEDLSATGNYTFALYTSLAGDQNMTNDTLWNIEVEHIPALTMPVTNMIPEDGTIDLETTVSLSWAPAPNATRYDIYVWEDGTSQPAMPQINDIPQINKNYSDLDYGFTYNWQVVAENVCDQMVAGPIQQYSIRELPDLVVDSVIAPPTAFSGQQIEVEWQVRNLGPGTTQSTLWSDAVFLSTDATLNTSFDIYLGAVQNLTALDSSGAYTNTGMFTIPNGFSGNYYVFVYSDRWDNLDEASDFNNWERTPSAMMITLTPPPDLKVETIAAPVTTFSGQTINVQYTVKNIGLEETGVNQWYDRVIFSQDPENYAGGIVIGTFNHTGTLEPDSLYTKNVNVSIPEGNFGNRYVYIITDWYNVVFENAGENNNVGKSDTIEVILTPPPDLVIYDMDYPDTVHNNEEVLLTYTLENQGGSTISTNYWYDRIYFSQSPVYNDNFLFNLGTQYSYGPLMPMEPQIKGHGYTMSNTASGEYYYYLSADHSDNVFEHTYESNNIVRSSGSFLVLNPDLRTDSVQYADSVTAGDNLLISWDIINDGPGKFIDRKIPVSIYLSDNAVFDPENAVQLTFFQNPDLDLDVGDTLTGSYSVEIPDGTAGMQYLYVFTDPNNQIFENGEDANNVARGDQIYISLPPYPDLMSREIVTPDTATAGELFIMSYEITNIGSDTISETSVDSIFLSFSPNWDPETLQALTIFNGVQALGVGDSQFVELNLPIPTTQTSNVYYVYIKSDATNKIFELTGENNNIQRSDSIFINPPLPVDLALDTVYTNTDTIGSGSFLPVTWKTANLGLRTADGIGWFDAGYLSVDTLLDRELDFRFFEHDKRDSVLIPASSHTTEGGGSIPNGFSGDYYLFVYADDYDSNMDIDSMNNKILYRKAGQPQKIHIELSPSPDLIIQNFAAPVNTIAGQPLSVTLTVKNDGSATAFPSKTKLYLSTDNEINSGDILLAADAPETSLPVGATHDINFTAFIPVTAIGNYVLIAEVDALDQLYEHNGEENNIQTRTLEVIIPPPSDLIVSAISIPDSAFAGDTTTVYWSTNNTGLNPASGMMREVIYFSIDTLLDVGDQVFGIQDSSIYVAPGGMLNRSFHGSLNGLARNDYFALIQTDARNNIYESDDSNNITPSLTQMNIDIEQLHLDSLTADVFQNGQQHYFRIEIPGALEGENLRITLDGDSLAAYNEIYLKFGDAPTPADFDANQLYAFKPDQELIFEDIQGGTYYIMCRGYNPAGPQNVTLLARVIDFELLAVTPGKITRNGQVTLELIGSQMDTLRKVHLVRDTTIRIASDTIYAVNSRRAYATFSLDSIPFYGIDEVPLGLYDVQAERADGKLAELTDAVEVIDNGEEPDLQFFMEYPLSVSRRGGPMKITIFFQNSGDADLVGEKFVFEAPYGNIMAFTYEDLITGNSSTSLNITVEGAFGPPGILPPKGSNVIEVFAWSRPHPTFALTPVNE